MSDKAVKTIEVRVRYAECDPMNVAHHGVFPAWLEMARTEMLRDTGVSYRQCEADGFFFVVARMNIRYRRLAHYDDVLQIEVQQTNGTRVKLEHGYRVMRDGELLAEAETTLVCVDREGRPQGIPEHLEG